MMKIFFEGTFGAEVAALASERASVKTAPLLASLPSMETLVRNSEFVAVPLWRNCAYALDQLDKACFAAGTPWMAVYLSGRYLIAGATIVPAQGPCYACFRKRYLTHHPSPERELVLSHFYDRDHNLGPSGFIQPMVWLAASLILDTAADPKPNAGRVRQLDLLKGTLLDTRVIRVHGCPRCGRSTASPRTRFVSSLIPELERCFHV